METPSRSARSQIVIAAGIRVTVHKSVRNNWKTIEHRDGKSNIVKSHQSRKAAIEYAQSVQ
jgi:hypothetical protein